MARIIESVMNGMFDFTEFPRIETERLVLREIVPKDVSALFRIRGDYEVTKYNTGKAYENMEQAAKLIDGISEGYAYKREIRWGIALKTHDQMIGMCGYNYWDRTDQRGSIGYDLAQVYWGKGFMPEALRAIIRFGFTEMGLNRIEADASVYNEASIKVLKKLAFTEEGIQREQYFEDGSFHDLVLFALLKKEFET